MAPPTVRQRIDYIDGLRGLAILWVYCYHVLVFSIPTGSEIWQLPLAPLRVAFGVNLFLVISGFCLYRPLALKPDYQFEIGPFLTRRIRRIYPPYLAALVFFTLAALLFILSGRSWVEGPNDVYALTVSFVAHLLMVHKFYPAFIFTIDHPLWTLTLEFPFYLTFPLLILISRRYSVFKCYLCVLAVSVGFGGVINALSLRHIINSEWTYVARDTFLARWPEFAAGMLAAHLIARRDSILATRRSTLLGSWQFLLCAALLLFALAFVSPHYPPTSLATETLFGLVALLVLLAASTPTKSSSNWVRAFLESKALVRFGTISYSFYLIHQPLLKLVLSLQWVQGLRPEYRFAFCMLGVLPLLLLVSSAFFHFVEKPFAKSANSRSLLPRTFPKSRFGVVARPTTEPT